MEQISAVSAGTPLGSSLLRFMLSRLLLLRFIDMACCCGGSWIKTVAAVHDLILQLLLFLLCQGYLGLAASSTTAEQFWELQASMRATHLEDLGLVAVMLQHFRAQHSTASVSFAYGGHHTSVALLECQYPNKTIYFGALTVAVINL
jgi:hypothetical protein